MIQTYSPNISSHLLPHSTASHLVMLYFFCIQVNLKKEKYSVICF